jgi:ribosomal protein L12E/L44/L45/RPP1/RPP2
MDSNTGGILGIFAFLTSAAGLIYAAINHKRIRCRCCGKDLDMSVDVDPTDAAPKTVKPPESSSADTAPVVEEEEAEAETEEEEEEEETQIQYVEPPKRKKKTRVHPV